MALALCAMFVKRLLGAVMSRLDAIPALFVLLGLALSPGPAAAQDAIRRYEEACDDGQVAACALLGLMLERGAGVPRDVARAATLYERACEGGEMRGCTNLGLLYESGTDVPRDRERAASLYRTACDAGTPLGCDLLQALERTAAAVAGGYVKAGRVEDASGSPLGEAIVEVPSRGLRALSDATGRVELGRLPAGRYGISAQRFGYEAVVGELEVPGNAEFVIRLSPATIDDPLAPGQIIGRVLAEGGAQGLTGVEIAAREGAARTLSNAQGRFTLRDVAPGFLELRFAHIGYATRTTPVIVQPGGTVEVAATLSTEAIELAPIEVSVQSGYLERAGFYSRARQGWGTQYGPEDLERIDPVWTSDLVRGRVPGVRVRMGRGGAMYAESGRSGSITLGPCRLPIYVDGMVAFDQDLDAFPPEWIAAMEIYHGMGTPIQYGGGCGAILIWTNR
jgi:hypothetical protein